MLKTLGFKLPATVLLSALTFAKGGAAEPIDRFPGAVCVPRDAESATDILYNSGGVIANMSEDKPAWVVCPVRTRFTLGHGQIVKWTATFITPMATSCSLRLFTLQGDLVGSTTGSPSELDDLDSRFLSLEVNLGDTLYREITASVHCKLPEASADGTPAGLIALTSEVID